MRIEWDERKNIVNIRKHGLDFADAQDVFAGPMLVKLDTRQDYGEDRWIGLGNLHGIVVVLVYTESEDSDVIRIISIRKATKNEHEYYENKISN